MTEQPAKMPTKDERQNDWARQARFPLRTNYLIKVILAKHPVWHMSNSVTRTLCVVDNSCHLPWHPSSTRSIPDHRPKSSFKRPLSQAIPCGRAALWATQQKHWDEEYRTFGSPPKTSRSLPHRRLPGVPVSGWLGIERRRKSCELEPGTVPTPARQPHNAQQCRLTQKTRYVVSIE
jgi:hypothetical protein